VFKDAQINFNDAQFV